VLFCVRAQGELSHQFCPTIGVVGVVWAFCQILGEIKLFLEVGLHEIRVDASGRSEYDFFYFGAKRFREDEPIEEKIRSRPRLVKIHVTPAAVIRCQVEYRIHALHRGARHSWLTQIRMDKFRLPAAEMLADIAEVAARQVIDDANLRSPRQ